MIAELTFRHLAYKAIVRLQWGRDQLIAELGKLPMLLDVSAWLQWGRDQLIAELGVFRGG